MFDDGNLDGSNLKINLRRGYEWKEWLAEEGYFITLADALTVAAWVDSGSRFSLIAQGPPGSGKTTLLEAVARVLLKQGRLQSEPYWVQCYEGVDPQDLLYRFVEPLQRELLQERRQSGVTLGKNEREADAWFDPTAILRGKLARALTDPDPFVATFLDEIDKVPQGSPVENSLLEYTDKQTITVNEIKYKFERPADCEPMLIGMTSNAGKTAVRKALSDPTLRRSKMIMFEQPRGERVAQIMQVAAPRLDPVVCQHAAVFLELTMEKAGFKKPPSIAEGKMWAETLQFFEVKELDKEVVEYTISDLAKGEDEVERLKDITKTFIKHIRDHGCFDPSAKTAAV